MKRNLMLVLETDIVGSRSSVTGKIAGSRVVLCVGGQVTTWRKKSERT